VRSQGPSASARGSGGLGSSQAVIWVRRRCARALVVLVATDRLVRPAGAGGVTVARIRTPAAGADAL